MLILVFSASRYFMAKNHISLLKGYIKERKDAAEWEIHDLALKINKDKKQLEFKRMQLKF